MSTARMTRFLTTSDAAAKLGYTLQHVRHLIRTGQLHARKIGRDWLIDVKSLNHVLEKRHGRKQD
jgi:excisionase family DNA binding protein